MYRAGAWRYKHDKCFNHFYNTNTIYNDSNANRPVLQLLFERVDRLEWCQGCGGSPMKRVGDIGDLDNLNNVDAREWNHFRIRQIGARTWVWLNGKLVVDGAVMENYWDRKQPLPAQGPIMLQTHGGEIRWRNVYLREIGPAEAKKLLAAPASAR